MQVVRTTPDVSSHGLILPLIRGLTGFLSLRQAPPYRLVYDERGRVVGRIVAPLDEQMFGVGRGAVYLTRD